MAGQGCLFGSNWGHTVNIIHCNLNKFLIQLEIIQGVEFLRDAVMCTRQVVVAARCKGFIAEVMECFDEMS